MAAIIKLTSRELRVENLFRTSSRSVTEFSSKGLSLRFRQERDGISAGENACHWTGSKQQDEISASQVHNI